MMTYYPPRCLGLRSRSIQPTRLREQDVRPPSHTRQNQATPYHRSSGEPAVSLRLAVCRQCGSRQRSASYRPGLVVGIGGVLVLLFSPLGGVIADRLDRRRVLIVGGLVPAIFVLVAAYLVTSEFAQPWHLVGIVLAMGLSKALSGPARGALVADLVPQ